MIADWVETTTTGMLYGEPSAIGFVHYPGDEYRFIRVRRRKPRDPDAGKLVMPCGRLLRDEMGPTGAGYLGAAQRETLAEGGIETNIVGYHTFEDVLEGPYYAEIEGTNVAVTPKGLFHISLQRRRPSQWIYHAKLVDLHPRKNRTKLKPSRHADTTDARWTTLDEALGNSDNKKYANWMRFLLHLLDAQRTGRGFHSNYGNLFSKPHYLTRHEEPLLCVLRSLERHE